MSVSHQNAEAHSAPSLFFFSFFFYVDSSFRLHLTLSHFGSMRRPLSLHQSLSFFFSSSKFISVFFPPRPPPPSPKHGTLLASLLHSLRTGSEKGSNSATPPPSPPLVKLDGAINSPEV